MGRVVKIGKSSQEKYQFTKNLLKIGVPYRQIQFNLKVKFGTGMSNTTLQNLYEEVLIELEREDRIKQLEREVKLFRQLYFELLEKMKEFVEI